MGNFVEGIFECIDQYEAEINGLRTSAAMAEAIRQGFFPGGQTPFGYRREPVELRLGVTRHRLVPDEAEALVVRALFQLYIAENGAKSVARALNQRGHRHRDRPWSKDLVLYVLQNPVVTGTLTWRRHAVGATAERLELHVEPIVDRAVFDLAQQMRASRHPSRAPGRASSPEHVLKGLLRCGKCGSSYQLETSGEKVENGRYVYCYYNCRRTLRSGKDCCPGFRIPTQHLDDAVLAELAETVCAPARVDALRQRLAGGTTAATSGEAIGKAWRQLIRGDTEVAHNYLRHLVDHIMVHENRVVLVPRAVHSEPA